jgi:16S rRNA (cytidine1402-2'-O)-methyltransferase
MFQASYVNICWIDIYVHPLSFLSCSLLLIFDELSLSQCDIFYLLVLRLRSSPMPGPDIDLWCRQCVIAREITKLHEEFWRGSIAEAKQEFLIRQPKGEITLLIEGKEETKAENPTESQLEEELRGLISDGHSLSTAVKTVAERTSMRKKEVYSLALKKFGKQIRVEEEDEADE